MSVLRFRYNVPRVVTVDPEADPAAQDLQVSIGLGIHRSETELIRNGIDPGDAQHLARLALLMFLSAFDHADIDAGAVYTGVIDHCYREQWTRPR